MKSDYTSTQAFVRTCRWLGGLCVVLILATPLLGQSGPELKVEHAEDGNCLLSWPVTPEEYVVVADRAADGAYRKALLASVTQVDGTNYMTVPASHDAEYFRLVRGQRFEDDFEDGNLDGWTVAPYPDPVWEGVYQVEVTNGHLRIRGTCSSCTDRTVLLYNTNLTDGAGGLFRR